MGLKRLVRKVTRPISKVASAIPGGEFIVPAVVAAVGGPTALAAYSGANTLGQGGSLLNALGSAGGSYLGGQIGSNYFPSSIGGTAANALGSDATRTLFDTISNVGGNQLAGNLFNASVGGAVGSYIGGSAGSQLGGVKASNTNVSNSVNSFSPTRQAEASAPSSLGNEFSGLNPEQKVTNLASRGVYGGGLGPQETGYFLNLVNRRLVDDSGKLSDLSNLAPIEQSYLNQLGYGGKSSTKDLLQAISGYGIA